jgi:hypothetical protein
MRANIALLLFTIGCTHTVTVLAPVHDVPKNTYVVAAIAPGQVTQFPRDAILRDGGIVVTEHNTILAHLEPSDKVAIEASGGEDFGSIRVRRKIGFDLLVGAGLVLIVGGVAGSLFGGEECNTAATRGHAYDMPIAPSCNAFALGGAAASLVGGVALIAFGSHGEITITASGVSGRF